MPPYLVLDVENFVAPSVLLLRCGDTGSVMAPRCNPSLTPCSQWRTQAAFPLQTGRSNRSGSISGSGSVIGSGSGGCGGCGAAVERKREDEYEYTRRGCSGIVARESGLAVDIAMACAALQHRNKFHRLEVSWRKMASCPPRRRQPRSALRVSADRTSMLQTSALRAAFPFLPRILSYLIIPALEKSFFYVWIELVMESSMPPNIRPFQKSIHFFKII